MKLLAAAIAVLSLSTAASAQESKSAPLARQLAAALDAAKLDAIAAKDPSAPDIFFAALGSGRRLTTRSNRGKMTVRGCFLLFVDVMDFTRCEQTKP